METSSAREGFVLLVERGDTRFPERPIDAERFLIGAGGQCQLQLGGEIPLLHSIIVREDDGLWIDAVAASPRLIVNGQPRRDAPLHSGDVIEIGQFVFCVAARNELPPDRIPVPDDLSAYTPSQLVDAIEEEIRLISQTSRDGQLGWQALEQAAQAADETMPAEADERESVQRLLSQLRHRAGILDQREHQLRERSQQLENMQQELQQQLDQFKSLLDQKDSENPPSIRLTA